MAGPLRNFMRGFDYYKKVGLILMSPGEKDENALIHAGDCLFAGILITTDGTNNATVIVYDNNAASGTIKWRQTVKGSEFVGGGLLPWPVEMENGYYVAVSGTGAKYIPYYVPVNI